MNLKQRRREKPLTSKQKEKTNLDDLQGMFQHLKLELLTIVHALEKNRYSK